MKRLIFFLQLIALFVLASCTDDPLPDGGGTNEVENTIIVYMPWSGDPGSLYNFFQGNLQDMK